MNIHNDINPILNMRPKIKSLQEQMDFQIIHGNLAHNLIFLKKVIQNFQKFMILKEQIIFKPV